MSLLPSHSIALVPDSADARLLVDLTSHATDLSEASHALGLALDARNDSELWLPLTMHAVTAYSRPFAESTVRHRLDTMKQFSGIPAALQPVHDMVRKYRNTTVAHSQSDLVLAVALALLDDRGAVRDVVGVTFTHPMPLVVAEQFAKLVDAVEGLVEEATRPVRERLKKQLGAVPADVVAGWRVPETLAAEDH
ncbi:hypothetical protein [Conyzicola sp.]|uniref:hypothetical protein n=1 Tax=Conyzicola sp. TaxID=1969404 RepID=UPI003988E8C9